jgi:regulator of nucleoside diphosphate kinase
MSSLPPVIMNSLDVERLERLLELPELAGSPAAAALQKELDRADVLDPANMPADIVTMNSRFTCRTQEDGVERELTLVYPDQADMDAGKVSVLAPVGMALLGLRIGQSIQWPGPDRTMLTLQVMRILYQPEASGDLHR